MKLEEGAFKCHPRNCAWGNRNGCPDNFIVDKKIGGYEHFGCRSDMCAAAASPPCVRRFARALTRTHATAHTIRSKRGGGGRTGLLIDATALTLLPPARPVQAAMHLATRECVLLHLSASGPRRQFKALITILADVRR